MQGALPGLVAILNRFVPYPGPPSTGASTVRRAADAITNLAHENISIKSRVRTEGGIPPLVALLGSYDAKVFSLFHHVLACAYVTSMPASDWTPEGSSRSCSGICCNTGGHTSVRKGVCIEPPVP